MSRPLRRVWLLNGDGASGEEQERRPAVSSQARTTAALKCFFRFLVEEERLIRDPALPLRTPKKREALPDVLTMGELRRRERSTRRASR